MTAVAIIAAFALALTMGMADAGNASANLAAARLGTARSIFTLSFSSHLAGALLSGTAVAAAVLGSVEVPSSDVITVMAAGTVATVVLLVFATRAGVPISAGLALVGGLAGAGWRAAGRDAVVWGGLHGIRPYGVLGAALAMVVAPVLGITAAVVGRRVADRVLRRASRRMRKPLDATLWVTSGLVGFADGTNDGQKAMAVIAAVLVARGSATAGAIPFWVRLTVGLTLATGTILGARVLRTLSRRIYATRRLDAVTAESASAAIILTSSLVGAPVSTTAVVASGVVGTGLALRPRHVHWAIVERIAIAWVASLPISMAAGAVAFSLLDLLP